MTWGCPHQSSGTCLKLRQDCEPGMRGCVLYGKVRFAEHGIRSADALVRAKRRAPLHPKRKRP